MESIYQSLKNKEERVYVVDKGNIIIYSRLNPPHNSYAIRLEPFEYIENYTESHERIEPVEFDCRKWRRASI